MRSQTITPGSVSRVGVDVEDDDAGLGWLVYSLVLRPRFIATTYRRCLSNWKRAAIFLTSGTLSTKPLTFSLLHLWLADTNNGASWVKRDYEKIVEEENARVSEMKLMGSMVGISLYLLSSNGQGR